MTDLEDQVKEAIATSKGDAQRGLADAFGYVRTHVAWIAGAVGLVTGLIVGVLMGLHS